MSYQTSGETTSLIEAADGKRKAAAEGDVELSKQLHDTTKSVSHHTEHHQYGGEVVKALVFGGMDGILTCFSVIAGAAGGDISTDVILILAVSSIFADAIAMGMGDFLSSKAHRDFVVNEMNREQWEYRNYRDGEIKEMVDLFEERGMERHDADTAVNIMAKYEDFYVRLMLTEELGHQPPEDDMELMSTAAAMFFAFCCFGCLPLIVYVYSMLWDPSMTSSSLYHWSSFITFLALFTLGALKSQYSALSWVYSGFETAILGGTCAIAAYLIGALVKEIVNTGVIA